MKEKIFLFDYNNQYLQKKKKTIVIIAGPTAVGKTAVAIKVAKHFNTRIISADSRQCFKELSIGVARPSVDELSEVEHYFIASHTIHQTMTAAVFEKYALQKAEDIFQENDTAVMVGGTGLYIKAFCEGLDDIPDVPVEIRKGIISSYKKGGMEWLQQQVKVIDPLFAERGEMQNPRRLMRALEVAQSAGRSIYSFHQNVPAARPFDIIKIALEVDRQMLYANISKRADLMISQGLVQEAENLVPYKHMNALQTVGYKELFEHFDGRVTLEQAIKNIKSNTRKYAKRQLTWFKKDKVYNWSHPNADQIIAAVKDIITG